MSSSQLNSLEEGYAKRLPTVHYRFPADPSRWTAEDEQHLLQAASCLRAGGLVAFPTETVYGLGVNALLPRAVPEVYRVKGRPSDNPLIVHVPTIEALSALGEVEDPLTQFLIHRFSPGPITYVVPKKACIPSVVTGGLPNVGLRIPSHPLALRLLEVAGVPVAAPSANRSGRPSPTRARDCAEDLDGLIPYLLDGGACAVGVESTVLDLTGPVPVILRPGEVGEEELAEALADYKASRTNGDPSQDQDLPHHTLPRAYEVPVEANETPPAPGMKYRHYAPRARVELLAGESLSILHESLRQWCLEEGEQWAKSGKYLGYFGCEEGWERLREQALSINWLPPVLYGRWANDSAAAQALFAALRKLDRQNCSLILAHTLPERGVGVAYCNRIRKAAGGGVLPSI